MIRNHTRQRLDKDQRVGGPGHVGEDFDESQSKRRKLNTSVRSSDGGTRANVVLKGGWTESVWEGVMAT